MPTAAVPKSRSEEPIRTNCADWYVGSPTSRPETPAPTLFESGDLPPFTASGVDPRHLLDLPWTLRHTAAAAPAAGTVLDLLEQAAEGVEMFTGLAPTHGSDAYVARMHRWLIGPPIDL